MDIRGFLKDYAKAIAFVTRCTPVQTWEAFLDDTQVYRNAIEDVEEELKENFGSDRLIVLERFYEKLKDHDGSTKFNDLMERVQVEHVNLKFQEYE